MVNVLVRRNRRRPTIRLLTPSGKHEVYLYSLSSSTAPKSSPLLLTPILTHLERFNPFVPYCTTTSLSTFIYPKTHPTHILLSSLTPSDHPTHRPPFGRTQGYRPVTRPRSFVCHCSAMIYYPRQSVFDSTPASWMTPDNTTLLHPRFPSSFSNPPHCIHIYTQTHV